MVLWIVEGLAKVQNVFHRQIKPAQYTKAMTSVQVLPSIGIVAMFNKKFPSSW